MEGEHSGMICLYRIQDLAGGLQDKYCIDCWYFTSMDALRDAYGTRLDCYEENVVSEEEFDAIGNMRNEKSVESSDVTSGD